jgi:hypothetical protein
MLIKGSLVLLAEISLSPLILAGRELIGSPDLRAKLSFVILILVPESTRA